MYNTQKQQQQQKLVNDNWLKERWKQNGTAKKHLS